MEEYLQFIAVIFAILFGLLISLFNTYRNVYKQYVSQVELNRKIMTLIQKRTELLNDN